MDRLITCQRGPQQLAGFIGMDGDSRGGLPCPGEAVVGGEKFILDADGIDAGNDDAVPDEFWIHVAVQDIGHRIGRKGFDAPPIVEQVLISRGVGVHIGAVVGLEGNKGRLAQAQMFGVRLVRLQRDARVGQIGHGEPQRQ